MRKFVIPLIILSWFIFEPVKCQVDTTETQIAVADTQNVNAKLFESDDLFDISLKFDITTYKRKRSDTTYFDAVLTYYTGDNDSISKKVKVRARGEVRRLMCDFPPISLNFKMKEAGSDEFIGINKLKLVPYCRIGFEDYVLREFLIYKLYNLLTPYSFRVRLMRINFINTNRQSKPVVQYGFALEPQKLLERRNHLMAAKVSNLTQLNVKSDVMDRFAIFNYMVGNTDWAIPNQHNALVYMQPYSERPDLGIAVPYDFDYAGLVNTNYAVPAPELPIKTVRDRLYMGVCRSEQEFTRATAEFLEKKEQFYKVINDFPYLSPRSKKDIINYLNGFYSKFDKHNSIVRELRNQCKEIK